jgi:hypothetical protein
MASGTFEIERSKTMSEVLFIKLPPAPPKWFEVLKKWKADTRAAFAAWEEGRFAYYRRQKQDEENWKSLAKRYGKVYTERPNEDFPDWGKGADHVEK